MMRSSPVNAVRPEPSQVFYASPTAIAHILCALFILFVASVYAAQFLLMPADEAKALLPSLLPLFGLGVLCEIALAFALSRLSPVRINEAGIAITNCWGRRHLLSWDEIETARPGNCLSAPYLKVSSCQSSHSALILPLEVTHPQALLDSVRHFALPDNPVRRFLERGDSLGNI